MNLLNKIQKLPEKKRKIIFWIVIFVSAILLLNFYIRDIKKKIGAIEGEKIKEQFQFGKIGAGLGEQLNEKLKQLEEELKKYEKK